MVTVTSLDVLQGEPLPVQVMVYCGVVTEALGIRVADPDSVTVPLAASTRKVDVDVATTFPSFGVFRTPAVMLITPASAVPSIMPLKVTSTAAALTTPIGVHPVFAAPNGNAGSGQC